MYSKKLVISKSNTGTKIHGIGLYLFRNFGTATPTGDAAAMTAATIQKSIASNRNKS